MMLIFTWFLYFIIYSVLGYTMEVIFCSTGKRKFVNRGFLFGPWCPIYGSVAVALIILTTFWQAPNILIAFLVFMLICATTEYITSYLLEKLFSLKWWDYSNTTPLNIHGRVCLETTVLFSLAGLFLIYFIHPGIAELVSSMPNTLIAIAALTLLVVFVTDLTMSTIATFGVRHKVGKNSPDMTQEIKKLVMAYYTKTERELRKAKKQVKNEIEHIQQDIKKAEEKIEDSLHLHKK